MHDVSSSDDPHPEIAELLAEMAAEAAPSYGSLSPDGARAFRERRFPTADDPEPVGNVMDLSVTDDGVPVRVYVPEGEGPHPALVFFHGGGWVLGDLDQYDAVCREIVRGADCTVVSVDYRLAPEHEFPAAVEDCYAVAEWVFDAADAMRVDTERVAVGGDSAGGNLATVVCLLARERDGPEFARQSLVYPTTDYNLDTPSYEENAEGYLLERADMAWFWDHYLPSEIHGANPYASPLRAPDLSGLPPATVLTCGFDPLRDEGAAYAERLDDAGVPVNHVHYEDAIHGILNMVTEPTDIERAHDLIESVTADLRETFE